MEGLFYYPKGDCLHEVEVFSADPNTPKWDSQKFKYMDDYYEYQKIKLDELPWKMNSTEVTKFEETSMSDFAQIIVDQNIDENKVLDASVFYYLLGKSLDTKAVDTKQALAIVQRLMEKVGMQFVDLDCGKLKELQVDKYLLELVIGQSDTSNQECSV